MRFATHGISILAAFLCLNVGQPDAHARSGQSSRFDEATMDRLAPRTQERIILYRFHPLPEKDLFAVVAKGKLTDEAFAAYNHRLINQESKSSIWKSFWTKLRSATVQNPGGIIGTGFWAKRFSPSWLFFTPDSTLIEVVIEKGTRIFDNKNWDKVQAEFPDVRLTDPDVFPVVHKENDVYISRVQEGITVREPTFEDVKTSLLLEFMRDFQREKKETGSQKKKSTADAIYDAAFKQLASRKDYSMEEISDLPNTAELLSFRFTLADLEQELTSSRHPDLDDLSNKYFVRNKLAHELSIEVKDAMASGRYSTEMQAKFLNLIDATFEPRKRHQYTPLSSQFSAELQAHYADINGERSSLAPVEIRRHLTQAASYALSSQDQSVASHARQMLDISRKSHYGAVTVALQNQVAVAIRQAKSGAELVQLSEISRFHRYRDGAAAHEAMMEALSRIKMTEKDREKVLADVAQTIFYEHGGSLEISAYSKFVEMTMSDDAQERDIAYEGLDIFGNSVHGAAPMLSLAEEIPFQHLVGMIEGVEGMTPRKPYIHLRAMKRNAFVTEEAKSFFWTLATYAPSLLSEISIREIHDALDRNPPPINQKWAERFQNMSRHRCETAVTKY